MLLNLILMSDGYRRTVSEPVPSERWVQEDSGSEPVPSDHHSSTHRNFPFLLTSWSFLSEPLRKTASISV